MQQHRLAVDPNPGNLMWHPNNGFTVLDYFKGEMDNADASVMLEVLMHGVVAKPESLCHDELEGDTSKIHASKRLLRKIGDEAKKHFGSSLPTDFDSIAFSYTQLQERLSELTLM